MFFTIIGLYAVVEKMISESELKMNDQINKVRLDMDKLYKQIGTKTFDG